MVKRVDEPLFCLWFGNFYRPAFDDRAFLDASLKEIARLGFNCVELDSKAWQDFQDRFAGGEASDYVAQQEYLMVAAHRAGLAHLFLALYLNGDNLYPHIRFSPPVYGESVTAMDGSDGRWYKYWSEQARESQAAHVRGLLQTYKDGHAAVTIDGEERLPLCSMWDPVAAPSFDAEGQRRYGTWLQKRYGDIGAFNQAYQKSAAGFDALRPDDWWFEAAYPGKACCTRAEMESDAPAFRMWADNMRWRRDELTDYFQAMRERLHEIDPRLYLMPNLSQWNHYLNVDTSRKSDIGLCELWDTANRGIDMRAVAPYVDMAHYYTLPVTADSDPEPYAVSCQHAHIRSLNPGRSFLGGVFWGRFLYNDVYRFVTPEETIGSIVQSGAAGIMAYGWCGMDDGGLLHRMNDGFLDSLARGNRWAKQAIPRLGQRKRSRVALLFPTAMALLEPLGVQDADQKRADLLGLYKACRDFGYDPEIVEIPDLLRGLEADVLLIPADECYHALRDRRAEEALRRFTASGGVIVHGPDADIVRCAFGTDIQMEETRGACLTYENEGGLPSGARRAAWTGEALAVWREDHKNAVSKTAHGKGTIYSFGFLPGFSYASRTAPHVPLSQGNEELYPIVLMCRQPLRDILARHAPMDAPFALTDVECTAFAHGWVAVNHRSTPVSLALNGVWHPSQPAAPGILPAHSCAWIEGLPSAKE
ncbi:MAG: beta-galactosidase [Clostridia bacterium]|nr:beta-galactosidase [Clostridia bacterium]